MPHEAVRDYLNLLADKPMRFLGGLTSRGPGLWTAIVDGVELRVRDCDYPESA